MWAKPKIYFGEKLCVQKKKKYCYDAYKLYLTYIV